MGPKKTRPKTGGRKAGTPNKASVSGRDIAAKWGPAAIQRAAEMAGLVTQTRIVPNAEGDGETEEIERVGMAINETVRMAALNTIIDRAYGKATQPISGDDDMPEIRAALKVAFVRPNTPKAKTEG